MYLDFTAILHDFCPFENGKCNQDYTYFFGYIDKEKIINKKETHTKKANAWCLLILRDKQNQALPSILLLFLFLLLLRLLFVL